MQDTGMFTWNGMDSDQAKMRIANMYINMGSRVKLDLEEIAFNLTGKNFETQEDVDFDLTSSEDKLDQFEEKISHFGVIMGILVLSRLPSTDIDVGELINMKRGVLEEELQRVTPCYVLSSKPFYEEGLYIFAFLLISDQYWPYLMDIPRSDANEMVKAVRAIKSMTSLTAIKYKLANLNRESKLNEVDQWISDIKLKKAADQKRNVIPKYKYDMKGHSYSRSRKCPPKPAREYKLNTKKRGLDQTMWIVKKDKNGSLYWGKYLKRK